MFDVVFVCSGNRCRSPVAEQWLNRFSPGPWLRAASTGTLDLRASRPPHEMIEVAAELGLDLGGHRSRHISSSPVDRADLVIGMALEHVATSVVDWGADATRSFTLVELVDLLKAVPPVQEAEPEARARRLVAAAHDERSQRKGAKHAIDIVDPIGGPYRLYRDVTEQIRDLCSQLADALRTGE